MAVVVGIMFYQKVKQKLPNKTKGKTRMGEHGEHNKIKMKLRLETLQVKYDPNTTVRWRGRRESTLSSVKNPEQEYHIP